MPDAPTVCWICEGTDTFGTARAITNLATGLGREGVDVRLLSVGEGPFVDQLRAEGHPVDVIHPAVPVLESGLSGPRTVALIIRWLATSAVLTWRLRRHPWIRTSRVVHVLRPNLLLAAGLCGPTVRKGRPDRHGRNGRRVVWEMANAVGASDAVALGYRLLVGSLRIRTIANSRWTAGTLIRDSKPHAVPVMYLSADPADFPARPRATAGPAVTLLMAARVHPSKMQLDVVTCLHDLAEAGGLDAEIRLVLAGFEGRSPYEHLLAQRVTGPPRVKADGKAKGKAGVSIELHPPTADVADLMADADVVLAVRRDPEPFGLSVIEAMMCGRPVLAGGVGGPAETVVDGVTGWLVTDLSPAGLKCAIRRVLADRSRWAAMGEAAAGHARASFTPAIQARRYRELVEI